MDLERLDLAGHSLGAIAVSVAQGYGAPGADPWPGQLDTTHPVDAVVAWFSRWLKAAFSARMSSSPRSMANSGVTG